MGARSSALARKTLFPPVGDVITLPRSVSGPTTTTRPDPAVSMTRTTGPNSFWANPRTLPAPPA